MNKTQAIYFVFLASCLAYCIVTANSATIEFREDIIGQGIIG